MNKPNPLVPQGTFADKGKSHIRITVFAILAVHVVLLGVLLIAGCNKKDNAAQNGDPGLPPNPAPLANDVTNPTAAPWPGTAPTTSVAITSSPVAHIAQAVVTQTDISTPIIPTTITQHAVVQGDS
ncbi:MAG: hypothetical protein QOF48_2549, partial [Verrucomicrobiota bacterium]